MQQSCTQRHFIDMTITALIFFSLAKSKIFEMQTLRILHLIKDTFDGYTMAKANKLHMRTMSSS